MFVNNTCLKYLNSDTSQACADRAYLFLRSSSKRRGMAGTGFLLECVWDYAVPGHSTGLRAGGATGICQCFPVAPPPSGQEMRAE